MLKHLRRAVGSLWVRLAVTIALLALVATRIDWGVASDRIAHGHWGWFLAAIAALYVGLLLGAARWHLLLHAVELGGPRLQTLRAYAIGVFCNTFLPTSVGGDAVRAWIVGRSGTGLVRALTSVVVDRLTALVCVFVVAWVALAAAPGSVPGSLVTALAWTSAAGVLIAGLSALAIARGQRLGGLLPPRALAWGREARGTVLTYARDRELVAAATALGVAYQVSAVGSTWLIAKALGIELPFALAAVSVALVLTLTMIPISVAGFGLREGGFVVLLGEAGIGATDAALISLIGFLVLALSGLPGAIAGLAPGGLAYARRELDSARAEGHAVGGATDLAREPVAAGPARD